MHHANLVNSARLQRVLCVLEDAKRANDYLTTRDIMWRADVCAVNSAVAELRCNGIAVDCERVGDVWRYRLAERQTEMAI